MNYADDPYWDSPEWRHVRNKRLRRDGYRCQKLKVGVRCMSSKGVAVYHRTYERYGHEVIGDLVTVCEACMGLTTPDE